MCNKTCSLGPHITRVFAAGLLVIVLFALAMYAATKVTNKKFALIIGTSSSMLQLVLPLLLFSCITKISEHVLSKTTIEICKNNKIGQIRESQLNDNCLCVSVMQDSLSEQNTYCNFLYIILACIIIAGASLYILKLGLHPIRDAVKDFRVINIICLNSGMLVGALISINSMKRCVDEFTSQNNGLYTKSFNEWYAVNVVGNIQLTTNHTVVKEPS